MMIKANVMFSNLNHNEMFIVDGGAPLIPIIKKAAKPVGSIIGGVGAVSGYTGWSNPITTATQAVTNAVTNTIPAAIQDVWHQTRNAWQLW